MLRLVLLILSLLAIIKHSACAQHRLPILRSTRGELSIREGASFYKDQWHIDSATKPDIFVTQPVKGKERLIFYSDLDSLVFWVKPNRTYDFVVLVPHQDPAYTRITSYLGKRPTLVPQLYFVRSPYSPPGPDTLRFRLDAHFGIHLQGQLNGSAPLDFLFDTGASVLVLTAAAAADKVQLLQDGQAINTGADGKHTVLTSSGNRLQIGNLIWPAASLITIDYHNLKNISFDGVLGWVAFKNKIVEVDYEHQYLVIHAKLPTVGADYASVEMKLANGIPFIKCGLTVDGRLQEGWFDLDTGSDGWLVIGQQFTASQNLLHGLSRVGTGHTSGSAGGRVTQGIYTLPTLSLGRYQLYQLPLYVNEQDPVGGALPENIGTEILKRFNLLLDFQANQLYMKPNKFLYSPLKL